MTKGIIGVVAGILGTGYFAFQFLRYLDAYRMQKLILMSSRGASSRVGIPTVLDVFFQLGLAFMCIYLIYRAILFIQKSKGSSS
jgi:hypothetical protein